MFKNVDVYSKPHGTGNGESSGGAGTVIIQTGNINQVPNELNINSITANRADFDHLKADAAAINDANIIYLMSSDGIISKLSGNELNYEDGYIKNLTSDQIETNKLTVKDTAYIKNLISEYIQSNNITTDFLTVNQSAHFFELVIDKIRSVQGTQINTAANCVIDYVEAYNSNNELTYIGSTETDHYRVYWKNTDGSGHAIDNDWITNDQAICETFNVVSGTTSNADNKYYWRLVTNSSSEHEPRYINLNEDYQGSDKISYDPISYYTVSFNDDFSFLATGENSDTYDINSYTFTNYNIKDQYTNTVLEKEEEEDTIEWRVRNVNQGIQLIPMDDNMSYTFPISKGTFSFSTYEPTNLNIGVYYDDNTFEYFPADGFKTDYSIDTKQDTAAAIEAFVITSDSVEEWSACNWIDLSNTEKAVSVNVNDIPERGDNLAQLGYRYGENATDEQKQRGSAIIIAAYRTPDPDVKCPTFSQYQNINDFSLSTHRGTWIDRTGCYIKGNLVSESGDIINIDEELNINTESYRLIPSENPIVKPASRTKTIVFDVLHILNGSGQILTSSDLSSWYITVQGNGVSVVSDFDVEVNTSATQMKVSLYDSNNVLKDTFTATIIDLSDVSDGADGKNGDYHQWIYKNATSRPDTPAWASPCPPSGWSETSSSPGTNSYTWMSQRLMSYTASNDLIFGYWTTPSRISGADGEPGADGNSIEFIYHRYDRLLTNSDLESNTYNPYLWNVVQTPDYTGPSVYGWTDQPQGITEVYSYEYISTREKINGSWSYFNQPKLWSKYGEKGMDGDGVEYIFCAYHSATGLNSPDYNTYNGKSFTEDDFVPIGWSDDPMSPTKANSYVFVSQRKSINSQWIVPNPPAVTGTPWSEPAIWSHLAQDGQSGQPGNDGVDGENGVVDKLVPYITQFEVRTTSTSDYSDIVSKLYANLQYQVWHADGDVVSQVTGTGLNNYSIKGTVRAASRDILIYNLVTATGQDGFVLNNNMFKLTDGSNYYMTNMLDHLGYSPFAVYHDYRKLSQSSSLVGNYLPIEIYVELLYNNQVVDSKVHEVIFKAGHVFEVTDAALNSAFFGSWTKKIDGEDVTVNGMSQIHQNMEGIETNVSTLSNNLGTLQSDYSTFKQTAQGFQSYAYSQINNIKNQINSLDDSNSSFTLLDLTASSYNNNYFYPCWFDLSVITDKAAKTLYTFQIDRPLDVDGNYGRPSWGNTKDGTNRGSALNVQWKQYMSKWGENPHDYIYYDNYDLSWTSYTNGKDNSTKVYGHNKLIPSSGTSPWRYQFSPSNKIIFYLRGGSKYNARVDYTDKQINAYCSYSGQTFGQGTTTYTFAVVTSASNIELPEVDAVKYSYITQTAENISMRVNQQTVNGLQSTGIDITNNLITLNSQNTVINGDLDLRGNFTSENQTTKNKIVIDAYNGGLNMYGPTHVDDDNWNLPVSASTPQGKIFGLNYGVDADNLSRIGILEVGNAADSSQYVSIDGGTSSGGGIEIADNYHKIYLSSSGIGFDSRWNTSDEWGTAESNYASWGELLDSSLSISGEVNYTRTIPNQNIVICNPTSAAITLNLENPTITEPLAQHTIVNKGTKAVNISSPDSTNYTIIRNGSTGNVNLGPKHTYTLLWIGDGWAITSFV